MPPAALTFARLGAAFAGLAVLAGAFGAHALRARLSPEALGWWHTAVQWQAVHALGLLALAALLAVGRRGPPDAATATATATASAAGNRDGSADGGNAGHGTGAGAGALAWTGWLFVLGLLVFCGSLYAMALGAPRQLGAVTPIGGLAWVAGWALLAARLPGAARRAGG